MITRPPRIGNSPEARLRVARRQCGFTTAASAAAAFGWNLNTYAANENGNAAFSRRLARQYADAFGVDWQWLSEGTEPRRASLGPNSGVVGILGRFPDGQITWLDDSRGGDPTLGLSDPSLLIDGTFAPPLGVVGSLIYYAGPHRARSVGLVDRLCVVGLEGDQGLLGVLRQEGRAIYVERLSDSMAVSARVRWASPVTVVAPPVRTTV
jgi:DNA-binding XRE family transcriptional regulator